MKDAIKVREATADDARANARVLVDGWQTTYAGILPGEFLASFTYDGHEAGTREHLTNLPASSAVFVGLAEDGSVAGVVHVREAAARLGDLPAELDALYVLPPAQRRGIGSRLFLRAVRWVKAQGHRSLFLWVLQDNPYRSFYDRLSGELLSEQKQDDFGGRDRHLGRVCLAGPRGSEPQTRRGNLTGKRAWGGFAIAGVR